MSRIIFKTYHEPCPDDQMHQIFKKLPVVQIVEDLYHQLEAYQHNEWPLNMPVKDGDPFAWWRNHSNHPNRCVL